MPLTPPILVATLQLEDGVKHLEMFAGVKFLVIDSVAGKVHTEKAWSVFVTDAIVGKSIRIPGDRSVLAELIPHEDAYKAFRAALGGFVSKGYSHVQSINIPHDEEEKENSVVHFSWDTVIGKYTVKSAWENYISEKIGEE